MNVIRKKALADFWAQHAAAKGSLAAWYREVKKASWSGPQDVKARYPSASFLTDNRVVFNFKGIRLVVHVNYRLQIVLIKFVGTHAEYDKINAAEVNR